MDLEPLLRAARAGDRRAWSQLGRVLFTRLYAYFRRGTSHADAQDLAQETIALALQRLHALESAESLVGWVFTVARNLLHAHQRFGTREAALREHLAPPVEPDGLITAAQKSLRLEVLDEEIAKLPDHKRDVVEHDLDEARNLQAIADRYGVALSTVRMWRTKAHKDLAVGVQDRTQTPPTAVSKLTAASTPNST